MPTAKGASKKRCWLWWQHHVSMGITEATILTDRAGDSGIVNIAEDLSANITSTRNSDIGPETPLSLEGKRKTMQLIFIHTIIKGDFKQT